MSQFVDVIWSWIVEAAGETSWSDVMPLGLAGIFVWLLWLYRAVLSRFARPVINDFRTTVSVVVPAYREDAEILIECLHSWLSQNPYEVIIVPDVDDAEVLSRLAAVNDPRLKKKGYGREVGFGQYAITALDHANGVATIANNGVYNKAHFVREVDQRDSKTGKFVPVKGAGEKLKPIPAFSPDVAAAAQNVMEKIPGINNISLDNGRKAIGKTGTWEFTGKGGKKGDNGDAWMVGATKQLAAAVWVGREKENPKTKQMDLLPIYKPGGKPMNGGSVPGEIWKMFLDSAMKAMNAPEQGFLENSTAFVDPTKTGNGTAPPPKVEEEPDNNQDCGFLNLNCPDPGNNGNDNDNDGQPPNTTPSFPADMGRVRTKIGVSGSSVSRSRRPASGHRR